MYSFLMKNLFNMGIFKEDKIGKAKQEAEELWQIREKEEELWITFNGASVIPESLLKKPALETLKELRERYVKSKTSSDAET